MATHIKVKTIQVPNLSASNVEDLEGQIENVVKAKINDGYSLEGCAGGDCFVILIFKKIT
jgi:hypothetical protein